MRCHRVHPNSIIGKLQLHYNSDTRTGIHYEECHTEQYGDHRRDMPKYKAERWQINGMENLRAIDLFAWHRPFGRLFLRAQNH